MSNKQEEAEKITDRILASGFIATSKVVYNTAKNQISIFVPLSIATYILHTQSDRLVLGIGVALGLYGLGVSLKTSYDLEKRRSKRR